MRVEGEDWRSSFKNRTLNKGTKATGHIGGAWLTHHSFFFSFLFFVPDTQRRHSHSHSHSHKKWKGVSCQGGAIKRIQARRETALFIPLYKGNPARLKLVLTMGECESGNNVDWEFLSSSTFHFRLPRTSPGTKWSWARWADWRWQH